MTRVVAKQAKTTKGSQNSKTNLLMEKKSSKEYSVVFLVEGEKFNLGEKKLGDINSCEKFKFASSVLFELGRHTA